MSQPYDVFISHAGEDKKPLAILIYEILKRRGIRAFLDQKELLVGGNAVNDMDVAMQTALVGLFILSPEFALKPYPMKELLCFLRRAGMFGESSRDSNCLRPVLIPVFYRLTVAESKYVGEFEKVDYDQILRNRFDERVSKGETSLQRVLEALTLLAQSTGVENADRVTNADTEEMARGRALLAERICDEVTRVLMRGSDESKLIDERERSSAAERSSRKELYATFKVPQNPREVVLNFSGIIGTGGVGKSCILRGVGRVEEMQDYFPGGIYYVSLGMDASIDTWRSELMRVLKASGGKRVAEELRDEKSVEIVLEEVRQLMGGGRSLIMVDDVWERNNVDAELASKLSNAFSEEHGGVIVITTRFDSVALSCDATVHVKPREATSEMSRAILLNYSKFSAEEVDEGLRTVVDELLMLGGGLPVCLAVIGRGVRKVGLKLSGRRGRAWEIFLEKVKSNEEYLLREKVGEYKGLKSTLLVALQILEEEDETSMVVELRYSWSEMYRSLCVMKKQMVIPVSVLERMWMLGCAGDVWKVLEGFVNVGLGEIVVDDDEGLKGFKIHDLLHTFAVSLATTEGEVSAWHRRLLDGYIDFGADGVVRAWWSVEDDGYIHENICRHLVGSGSTRELVMLLERAEWTMLTHKVGGRLRWVGDFAECLETVSGSGDYEEGNYELRRGLCQVRDAVVESWMYVRESPAELGYQVFGRLLNSREGSVRRYLESVKTWHPRPWVRPVSQVYPLPGKVGLGGAISVSVYVEDVVLHSEPFFAVVGVGEEVVVADLQEMRVTKRLCLCDYVRKVWLSDDGLRVLSLSEVGQVQEWSIGTGKELRSVCLDGTAGSGGPCARNSTCATFSRDGKLLATGHGDGTVVIWEVQSGQRVGGFLRCFDGRVSCVAMSSDGSRVVVGGREGQLHIWNILTVAQEKTSMRGHKLRGAVWCVAFSSDGRRIVSGFKDGTICLWDSATKTQVGDPFRGHEDGVACVTFSADCGRIVSSAYDRTVRMWDCNSGEQVGPTLLQSKRAECVAVSSNGRFVVCGAGYGSLRVWDLEAASDVHEEPCRLDRAITFLTGSPNGDFFVSGSSDGTLRIWDGLTGVQNGEALRGHTDRVFCVAVSPDSQRFVSGADDETLIVWNVESQKQVGETIRGLAVGATCVAYSPDGQFFVSGFKDGTIGIWRLDNHAQVGTSFGDGAIDAPEFARWVESVAVSPDGRRILCSDWSGAVFVWDIHSRRIVGEPQAMGGSYRCQRFEFIGENEVRSLDLVGEYEVRWRLDDEKGLVRRTEGHLAWSQVVCRDRFVQCAESGVALATLPLRAASLVNRWHYDSLRGALGVGLPYGRVLVFHVET